MCCALPLTLPGRWRTPDTRGQRWRRQSSSLRNTRAARLIPTPWRCWPILPSITAKTATSPARPCSSCSMRGRKRMIRSGGPRKKPASTPPAPAPAWKLPDSRCRRCSSGALLLATEKGAADVRGTLQVLLNGKPAEKLELTPDNNDLLHQFVFKGLDSKEPTTVQLRFEGKGGLAYQVVGSYFLPWDKKPDNEPLSIDVAYDRTRLAQDDIATATATIKNNLPKSANMVMVDLGIPPGFDLLSEDLQVYQEKSVGKKSGRLEKFSLTATQAILYFDSFAAGDTATLRFRLRAKYPMRARTFQSRVYAYYDPEVSSLARPIQLEVRAR